MEIDTDRQLEIFPFEALPETELRAITLAIRGHYWYLRNLRGGRFGQAHRRSLYRKVEVLKERLLLSGIRQREILDFLRCCRNGCQLQGSPCIGCYSMPPQNCVTCTR
jgi:hypothetical protein